MHNVLKGEGAGRRGLGARRAMHASSTNSVAESVAVLLPHCRARCRDHLSSIASPAGTLTFNALTSGATPLVSEFNLRVGVDWLFIIAKQGKLE
jgi:hypothetical protein